MTKDQFAQAVADALRDFATEVAGQDEGLPWLTEILVEELAPRVAAMCESLDYEQFLYADENGIPGWEGVAIRAVAALRGPSTI